MVSIGSIIGVITTLLISLLLPLVLLLVYALKNKKQGLPVAWLLGAAGFLVMQIVIRLPILTLLSKTDGYVSFANNQYVLYCLILAFTAGLFEVIGRYVIAKILSKRLSFRKGIAAGLGHGGIEAIVIIGIAYINNLIYIIMINTGTFDQVISQTAAMGIDIKPLYQLKDQLIQTRPLDFFLAGYERILTMVLHVALSLLVCYFVYKKKDLFGILLCLIIHTIVDFFAPLVNGFSSGFLSNKLSQNMSYVIIYAFLTIVSALMLFLIFVIKKRWKQAELPS